MKKLLLLAFFAVLALLLASCAKEEQSTGGDPQPVGPVPSPTTEFIAYSSSPEASNEASNTKTYWDIADAGKVKWSLGDQVYISNGETSAIYKTKKAGETVAVLNTEQEITGETYYAIYPQAGASYADGVYNLLIPDTQACASDGTFGSNTLPMVATCGVDRKLVFKNTAGIIKFVLNDPAATGISLVGMSVYSDEPMAGKTEVLYSEGINPVVKCTGTNSVTVTCGVHLGQPVYVVVAPGVYSNVSLSISLSDGRSLIYKVSDKITVVRSKYTEVICDLSNVFEDLSKNGTANCYAISTPGSYKFPVTVKGNGVTTSNGISSSIDKASIGSVIELYSDGSKFVNGGFTYSDGYVYFSTVGGGIPSGTVILAARTTEGKILWSWLLWGNQDIKDVATGATTWINMNIGAHQTGWNDSGYMGYYYQWGRKDPICQKYTGPDMGTPWVSHASKIDGSVENSVLNPTTFYGSYYLKVGDQSTRITDWASYRDLSKVQYDLWCKGLTGPATTGTVVKTMWDPCPPGYNVPTSQDFYNLRDSAGSWTFSNGCWIHDASGLIFPQTSFRSAGVNADYWNRDNTVASYLWTALPADASVDSATDRYDVKGCRGWVKNSAGVTVDKAGAYRAWGHPVRCVKSK